MDRKCLLAALLASRAGAAGSRTRSVHRRNQSRYSRKPRCSTRRKTKPRSPHGDVTGRKAMVLIIATRSLFSERPLFLFVAQPSRTPARAPPVVSRGGADDLRRSAIFRSSCSCLETSQNCSMAALAGGRRHRDRPEDVVAPARFMHGLCGEQATFRFRGRQAQQRHESLWHRHSSPRRFRAAGFLRCQWNSATEVLQIHRSSAAFR